MVDGQYQVLWQGVIEVDVLPSEFEAHVYALYTHLSIQSSLTFQAVW